MTLAALDDLHHLSEAAAGALCERFRGVGFTAALVAECEAFVPGVLRPPRLPLLRWWLAQRPEPGAALARLFQYDDALSDAQAERALGAEVLRTLLAAGVVGRDSKDRVVARFLLTPFGDDVWILSDELGASADAVMGPGGGTEYLASLIPPGVRGAVLDVGCGAGSLTLAAAKAGARRAVGIDLNARAVALARVNARLNGLRAEFHVGDAVEPVAGERFQLVLSQPPYVVRPAGHGNITFLYGGPSGDELPLHFIRSIPRVLAPGGRAFVLMQCAARPGEPLGPRMRRALADERVDLLTLVSTAPPPAVQASVFASFEDPSLGEHYAATAQRYLDHFDALEMRAFDGVLVAMSRAADAGLGEGNYTLGLKVGSVEQDRQGLESFLEGLELLERRAEVLERECLRLSPYAQVSRDLQEENGEVAARFVLRIHAPGIGGEWSLGSEELEILSQIDAAPTLGDVLKSAASGPGGVDAATRQRFLAFVRGALVRGALVRAEKRVFLEQAGF